MMEPPTPKLPEIMNQAGAILAIFGALGGSVRAALLRLNRRETIRAVYLGAAISFGLGFFVWEVAGMMIGDLPSDLRWTARGLASGAFVSGVFGVAWVEARLAKLAETDNE